MPASPLETAAAQQDPVVKAREEYLRKVDALERQQNALLESLQTRSPGDTLLSMAQGFLAPTRTGSFGESFGTGIGQLRASQAAEEKRAEELAKMRLAIGAQQLGTEKEKLQMTKDLALAQGIQGMLGGNAAASSAAGHPMVPGAAGASVMATPESAAFARSSAPAQSAPSFVNRLSPTARGLLGAQAGSDPQEVLKYMLKGEAEDAKVSEAVKTAEYYLQGLPTHLRELGRQTAANIAIFGKPEEGLKALAELGQAYRKGYISEQIFQNALKQIPSLYPSAGAAVVTPPSAVTPTQQRVSTAPTAPVTVTPTPVAPAPAATVVPSTAAGLPGGPAAPSAVAEPQERRGAQGSDLLSPEQRAEIESERLKLEQKSVIEQAAKARERIMSPLATADQRITDAKLGAEIVKNNPNSVGIFASPGFGSAVGTLAQSGINVGPFSINVPEIQTAALNLFGKQSDIDARSKLMQIAVRAQMEFAMANSKGSISNYENQLYSQTGVNANDSANVTLYKLDLMRARAQVEKIIATEYRKYEQARKGSAEDFANSEEMQKIRNSYDALLSRIQAAYSAQSQDRR